jgi:hypothetical protein
MGIQKYNIIMRSTRVMVGRQIVNIFIHTIMRNIIITAFIATLSCAGYTQSNKSFQQINKSITKDVALEPLYYLASDELKGRSPVREEIYVAANYIRDHFKKLGIKAPDSTKDYYQAFELTIRTTATQGSLIVNNHTLEIGKELTQIGGKDVTLNAPIIFAGYGSNEEIDTIDVKGKIVVTRMGAGDSSSINQAISEIFPKQSRLQARGAIAMVELFHHNHEVPWNVIQRYLGGSRFSMPADALPSFVMNPNDSNFISTITSPQPATLSTTGNTLKAIPAINVIGWVQGTDPKLKDQFILLSAHYDHLGTTTQPKTIDGKTDSIFNGARDNAVGVTAVMNAARYFAKYPPRRSVMFVAFNAEEMGLLGSKYFSDHPVVPLNKIVYNLNCDNAGYNDTTIFTVVGLGRTSADNDIISACKAYGIKPSPDPDTTLNLFDRSDNVNLAVKGIPAPTFGMGITGFDEEVGKYYHQLGDEVSSLSTGYVLKYIRSYILIAVNIANNVNQPSWRKGDKYEKAWEDLYK